MSGRTIKVASFDMDGTILEHESSWVAIHKKFGTREKGEASLALYSKGQIDYREFMRRDIASWPKGVTKEAITDILSNYKVRREAKPTIDRFASRGVQTALVTSGIDILAEMVASELNIDHWVANGLRFGQDGVVLPEGIGRVDPTRKDRAHVKLLKGIGVKPSETIAVGDTIYDLGFLKTAGKGFMLAHSTRVDDPNIIHIDSLSEIFDHIEGF